MKLLTLSMAESLKWNNEVMIKFSPHEVADTVSLN